MVSIVAMPRCLMPGGSVMSYCGERVEDEAAEAGWELGALARAKGIRAQRTWGAPMRVTCLRRRSRKRRERSSWEEGCEKVGWVIRCV